MHVASYGELSSQLPRATIVTSEEKPKPEVRQEDNKGQKASMVKR